jgi:hypothetical protein
MGVVVVSQSRLVCGGRREAKACLPPNSNPAFADCFIHGLSLICIKSSESIESTHTKCEYGFE